jgi:hypothetical protein
MPYTEGWAGMIDPRIESLWAHSGLRMAYGLPMFPDSCGISRAACWNAGAAGNYNSEPFSSSGFAGLEHGDSFGQFPGLPWAAAEFAQDAPGF